jgi:phospholipase C
VNALSKPAFGFTIVLLASLATACHGPLSFGAPTQTNVSDDAATTTSPIDHVIIIVQENRTPDYLFQGIRGADIATYATDYKGQRVPLEPISLHTKWDLGHRHTAFLNDYNDGKMNGFDKTLPERIHLRPFGYAPESEVAPYHEMARKYVLGDRMFQSNQGPSFPAHLYLVSGAGDDETIFPNEVSSNPHYHGTGQSAPGGCDAKKDVFVGTVDPETGRPGPTPFPCLTRTVLSDLLDQRHVSWRYYQPHSGPGLWEAMDAYRNIRYSRAYSNVVWPSQRILTDIKRRRLPNVSWVIPAAAWSDHAGPHSTTEGPSWVAAIVNAVGESPYWDSTAILVVWDDWGGWYDHVVPPIHNHYALGFRVPLLVISSYSKRGYVSKVEHEFGSLLVFVEKTFGIPKGALHSSDEHADDLKDCFDFHQGPRRFAPIKAPPFSGKDATMTFEDEDP